MRLDKYLGQIGTNTRSEWKKIIQSGAVSVNDKVIKDAGFRVNETTDLVFVRGEKISYQKFRYYMFHKPAGCITATRDDKEKTVMDFFPKELHKNLFPVGRLDKDTEGLLLLTTDGDFSHSLMSPKKHVSKEYYFMAQGKLTAEGILRLERGIEIGKDEKITEPAKIEVIRQEEDTVEGILTITEGRFHQVKRMLHAAGCEVTYLKRRAIGGLSLDEALEKGAFRELTTEEIKEIYE